MLRTRIQIDAKDPITVRFPKNGDRDWVRVQIGGATHELWVTIDAARQLYAQLGVRLAELDGGTADSAAGK